MGTEQATFAGGCFWCTEAVFKTVNGVEEVTSGYAGGHTENPTYDEVCTGDTRHAEAVQVTYDPETVSFEELLDVFFDSHNPTTKNRQGPDRGSQYRSVAFYHDKEQKQAVEEKIEALSAAYDDPIVTEVTPLDTFWEAAEEHQDYFEKHPNRTYCAAHIAPKVEKIEEKTR